MDDRAVTRLAILGAGPEAWISALYLKRRLGPVAPAITVLTGHDKPQPGALSTLPAIRDLHARLGLDDLQLVAQTGGTFKLGEAFQDAPSEGDAGFLPYGEIGAAIGPVRFHQQLHRIDPAAPASRLADYALAARAAAEGRFAPPSADPRSLLSTLDFGLHLDAAAYAALLRGAVVSAGATVLDDAATHLAAGENGHIERIKLASGASLEADLVIDTRLPDGDPADWLAVPSAFDCLVEGPIAAEDPPAPRTLNRAVAEGWLRKIPLQSGVWQQMLTPADAAGDQVLEAGFGIDGPVRRAAWTAGRCQALWQDNLIRLGPAGWRADPLAASDLTLLGDALDRLCAMFPHRDEGAVEAREFNRLMALEIDAANAFATMFHHCQARTETVWQAARDVPIAEMLAETLALFRSRGRIGVREFSHHDETRWVAALLAMGVTPEHHDPLADSLGRRALTERASRILDTVAQTAASLPTQAEFLSRLKSGAPA